jgi:predicted nucleic acid-binding protein
MIAVSDTSPLNYLALIGEIELLPRIFSRVLIPPAVISELNHARTPPVVAVWATNLPSWVDVVPPGQAIEEAALGRGETEAIAVALQVCGAVTLIDERKASVVARNHGLIVTETLGVLDIAAERGYVDLKAAVARLLQTNFRAAPVVIEDVLSRHR